MRSALPAATALALLCVPAAAADLATHYPIKAEPARRFSWTGYYMGANAGAGAGLVNAEETSYVAPGNSTVFYDFRNISASTYPAGTILGSTSSSATSSGAIAGGQIGFNYQMSNDVVIGAETDIQWSGIRGSARSSTNNTLVNFNDLAYIYGTDSAQILSYNQASYNDVSAGVDYFGTIRARLGYAMGRFLPYVTGGAAYGQTTLEGSSTSQTFINTYDYATTEITNSTARTTLALPSTSETKWGWTVGGGGEFAVTDNWTVKAEYLYVDLGSMDYAYLNTVDDTLHLGSVDAKFHTLKAGVNYKF